MDKKLKAKWVKALRSGKYKQGQHMLYRAGSETFCCLGVLGVCAGKSLEELSDDGFVPDGGYPQSKKWGLLHKDEAIHLAECLNDRQRKSFAEIADYIEANL